MSTDVVDEYLVAVKRAYDESGMTELLSHPRSGERRSAAWWLEWTEKQLDIAERQQDWRHVLDIMAVLHEVVKREDT